MSKLPAGRPDENAGRSPLVPARTRREVLKLGAASVLCATAGGASAESGSGTDASTSDRGAWVGWAERLSTPLLPALAERGLKRVMPVEAAPGAKGRASCTHLEGFGRLLCGIAPWLELGADGTAEGRVRGRLAELARAGLDAATDPQSPDLMNFSRGGQPLVDAAFLAQGLLRAPGELWKKLDARVQRNVIAALQSSRVIQPGDNNWRLFATMVEVFLHGAGARRDDGRLFQGIRKHREWYLGDGMYGDGPEFHWDYYNSYVIQPMLVEALDVLGGEAPEWGAFRDQARARLKRWAAVQERMIAPDGSFPVLGRSMAYRCGAFQGFAMAAWLRLLPAAVSPGQARVALTSVIRRTLEAPGTFDRDGWLRIGLAGSQPGLGEGYISTGSLYLCAAALLPLGLPATDPFWSEAPKKTTWQRAWEGENLAADHALRGGRG